MLIFDGVENLGFGLRNRLKAMSMAPRRQGALHLHIHEAAVRNVLVKSGPVNRDRPQPERESGLHPLFKRSKPMKPNQHRGRSERFEGGAVPMKRSHHLEGRRHAEPRTKLRHEPTEWGKLVPVKQTAASG